MVQAWYMTPDESTENPKARNYVDYIDIEDLEAHCGVEPFCVLRQVCTYRHICHINK